MLAPTSFYGEWWVLWPHCCVDMKLLFFISIMSLQVSRQHVVVMKGSSYQSGSSPLTHCCKVTCVCVCSGFCRMQDFCICLCALNYVCMYVCMYYVVCMCMLSLLIVISSIHYKIQDKSYMWSDEQECNICVTHAYEMIWWSESVYICFPFLRFTYHIHIR